MSDYTPTEKDLQRFWSKVYKRGPNECWNWQASINPKGYGEMRWQGPKNKAHRISWMIHYGVIPDGIHVLHECDNPACVNPRHLFLGTNADNVKDRDHKGRFTPLPGEAHGQSKLTWKQAREIRHRYEQGDITQTKLASEYDVSQSTVSCIILNLKWRE